MQKVNEIISKNIDGFIAKIKAWQGTMYNVKEYGLVGDGVTDDTAALQALINLAISEGRKTIFFPPGTYYVTSLVNDDKVFFVGDNATFTGGYTGVINQFGGGELNQNAFSKVNDLEADNPTDALTIAGGVGITVSTNPNTKTLTITSTGTATPGAHGSAHTEFGADPIPLATPTEGGLMSASDKAKLDSFCVSVKDFGAVGDGVADDTPAFQSAFDAIRDAGRGTVFVPKGTYIITSTLRIYANTTIWLDDHAVVKRAFVGGLFMNGEFGNANYASGYDGDGNIFVHGGTIDMNGENYQPSDPSSHGGGGFYIAHAQNVRFENVKFRGIYNSHYIEINSSKNVRIINCWFRDGITAGPYLYEAVQFDFAGESQFPAYGAYDHTTCDDIVVMGCTFENVHSGVGSHSSAFNGQEEVLHKNIRIIGNLFINTDSSAIRVQSWDKAIISKNQIYQSGLSGIVVYGSREIVISENEIDTTVQHGVGVSMITVDSTPIRSSEVVVSGNIIKNAGFSGVRGVSTKNLTVRDNRILGASERGIYCNQTTTGLLVFNNYIEGASQLNNGQFPAIDIQNSEKTLVYGNVVQKGDYPNTYNYALNVPSTNTYLVEYDNQFEAGTSGIVNNAGTLSAINREVMLTNIINVSSGQVTLLDDIRKYRHLIVATGGVSNGGLRHEIARGWFSTGFRPGTDFINVQTNNGKFIASVDTPTQITITTANDPLRYIIGVL